MYKTINIEQHSSFVKNSSSLKPIVTSTGYTDRVYDYSGDSALGDPNNGVMNLMDALEFDSHLAENFLVDSRGAHQILLIESDDVAMRLLGDRNRLLGFLSFWIIFAFTL